MSRAGGRYHADDGPVRLGKRIGAGGEGAVYAVTGAADRAAKIYRAEIAAEREGKVADMIAAALADKASLVAFPQTALRDRNGRFAGFLMPRIAAAEPLHELYAPGARKRAFPDADYRFLVRAALNTARAVAGAHAAGCVIGDVNHSGLLVGDDARVSLIDADSFQFQMEGRRHLCRVGVPEYTPPELQGRPLAGVVRTGDHDAFGLAVLLFQLLFLGRHPFAGVSSGDDVAVEEAIAAGDFAYARRGGGRLSPPPGALTLDEIPAEAAALFEAAFARGAAGRRPSAEAWVAVLGAFEAALTECQASPRHHHAAPSCPWCRIEAEGRAKLFPAPGEPGSAPKAPPKQALRERLARIALPESFAYAPPEPLDSSAPPPPSPKKVWGQRAEAAMFGVFMACAAALVAVSPQAFWMAIPIYWYGWGVVGDALSPPRAARRALAKIDQRLEIEIGHLQNRIELDAAWLLKADLETRLAGRRRIDGARALRDLARLEGLAAALADASAARDPEIEALMARRKQLAETLQGFGETPAPLPAVPPRTLRPATRSRALRAA